MGGRCFIGKESYQVSRSNLPLRVVDSLLRVSGLGESSGEMEPSG